MERVQAISEGESLLRWWAGSLPLSQQGSQKKSDCTPIKNKVSTVLLLEATTARHLHTHK